MTSEERERARFDAGCAGKERHVSRAAADAVAALSRAPLHAYVCCFCGGWHLAGVDGHRAPTADNGRGPRFERLRHRRRGTAHPRRPPTFPAGTSPVLSPAGCVGGAGYSTEIDAIRAARDSGAAVGAKLRGYLCACGQWHLAARGRGRR